MTATPSDTAAPAPFVAACLQVNAQEDMAANIAAASTLARQAREAGADLVLMPENVARMTWGREAILSQAYPEAEHPALVAFAELARELGVWLHCGSLTVRPDPDSESAVATGPADAVVNRSLLLDPQGEVRGRYDKIHMFDVDLAGGERYRESETFRPGTRAVTVDTPFGLLGMTICYDLRFAGLYRSLAQAGSGLMAVPAAFTRTTGQAHWHVLLRARAIETGSFVLAPAQTGTHVRDRKTFGHALIVDPWGEVLADAGEGPGLALARIDPARIAEARRMIPALTHDRPFVLDREPRDV